MDKAYVTVLSSDSYVKGILGLNKCITRYCQEKLFVIVQSGLKPETYSSLEKNEVWYEIYDPFDLMLDYDFAYFNYWKNTYFKFHIFELTRFRKIVYIDCDILVGACIDELFFWPHMSAVSDSEFCVFGGTAGGINSGVIVIEPDKTIMEKLIFTFDLVKMKMEMFGDQDVINYLFKNWENENDKHLPVKYNANYKCMHLYKNKRDFKVFHFAITPKPWNWDKSTIIAKMLFNLSKLQLFRIKALWLAFFFY